ncbi:MAG: HlyD family efflux transporter periplasmic adaptor subunit [Acidobacteria bacterium]|nr:HlyD family efflux transporter periplasmic adaptor subunit [Acidobacteriota bacterium]
MLKTLLVFAGLMGASALWLAFRHPPRVDLEASKVDEPDQRRSQTHHLESPSFLGVVLSDEVVRLSCPMDAFVKQMQVREGANVDAGEVLVQLEAHHLADDMKLAEASLRASRTALEEAKLNQIQAQENLERMRASQSIYPAAEIREAELQLARTDHRVSAAKSEQQQAQIRLDALIRQSSQTDIVSPISGTVQHIQLKLGQTISQGQTMLSVTAPSRGVVRFAVPPDLTRQIRTGDSFKLMGFEMRYQGVVTSIAPERDEPTQLVFCLGQIQADSYPPAGASCQVFLEPKDHDHF